MPVRPPIARTLVTGETLYAVSDRGLAPTARR